MKYQKKTAFIWSIVILILTMFFGNALYMNPLVMGIFEKYQGLAASKPMETFGGQGMWIMYNSFFTIVMLIIEINIFLVLYPSIPGKGITKGFCFGIGLTLIKALPEAFNQWMLFNYPTILILVPMINSIITYLFFGVIGVLLFEKMKVVKEY